MVVVMVMDIDDDTHRHRRTWLCRVYSTLVRINAHVKLFLDSLFHPPSLPGSTSDRPASRPVGADGGGTLSFWRDPGPHLKGSDSRQPVIHALFRSTCRTWSPVRCNVGTETHDRHRPHHHPNQHRPNDTTTRTDDRGAHDPSHGGAGIDQIDC